MTQREELQVTLQDHPADAELARYKRMFESACVALGEVSDALGVDPNEGGSDPILAAIAELKVAQPSQAPSDLRGIDAGPLSEWVDLVKRGYVAKDECLIAVKDVPKWVAQNGVEPNQALAALEAIQYYYDECTDAEPSISIFRQMVDRVVRIRPNFCESCAMDLATCDCVNPRPVSVGQLLSAQPSQSRELTTEQLRCLEEAHGISNEDAYFLARPQIDSIDRRNVFTAAHRMGWQAAINAKEPK